MAKTIKEIAEEIGVSKPAVHQKRKKEPLKSSLQPFTETVNGTVYIQEEGVKLIIQAFSMPVGVNESETVSVNFSESSVNDRKPVYGDFSLKNGKNEEVLHSLLHTLQGELEVKNGQIEALQKSVNDLTQALEHAHDSLSKSQALHAGTIQTQLDAQSQNTPSESPASPSEGDASTEEVGTSTDEKTPSKSFWKLLFQK